MSVLVRDDGRQLDGDRWLELPWLMQWTRRKSDAWPFRDRAEAEASCVAMGLETARLRFVTTREALA